MDRQEREEFGHAELIRHLGPSGPFDVVIQGWPVYDSLVALVLCRDERPLLVTSPLAQALGHHSRFEGIRDALPPKDQIIDWAAGEFGGDFATSSHSCGRWEVIFLGELDYPVPIAAMSDAEAAALPTETEDKLALGRALRFGADAAHTRILVVSDTAGPLETAFELSELLGYEPQDHQWIPQRWRTERAEPGFRWGFEVVVTADGYPVHLRYYSYRLSNASVYLSRVWLKDTQDVDALALHLPPMHG